MMTKCSDCPDRYDCDRSHCAMIGGHAMSELKPSTMTDDERLKLITWPESRAQGSTMPGASRTYKLALDAIRAQPANDPLTLDEMNALDHEPIYVLHTGGKWTMNGWHIATASSYQNHGRCDLEIDNGNTTIDMQNYGKTWLAYRHKPKEEHHEVD